MGPLSLFSLGFAILDILGFFHQISVPAAINNQISTNLQKPSWVTENPVPEKVFDILFEYLDEPSNSPEATAASLTAIFDQFLDSWESIEPNLEYLWATFFWATKLLSPDDEQQDRLATLLVSIQGIPGPIDQFERFEQYENFGRRLWVDLPRFIPILAQFETDAPLVPRLRDRDPYGHRRNRVSGPWSQDLTGDEWRNINALLARLHTASEMTHLDVRGLWAFLEALEEDKSPEALDNVVPAAACWILYACSAIKNNFIGYPHYDDVSGTKRLPWSVGTLYRGTKGFNDERWSFWRTRFREMMLDENLKPETRSYAERAWKKMSEE